MAHSGLTTRAEYQLNFQTVDAAISAALALHDKVRSYHWPVAMPMLRIGIHVGQIVEFVVDRARIQQAGHAADQCRRLTRLAVAGQTLLSRTGFDVAKRNIRAHQAAARMVQSRTTSEPSRLKTSNGDRTGDTNSRNPKSPLKSMKSGLLGSPRFRLHQDRLTNTR